MRRSRAPPPGLKPTASLRGHHQQKKLNSPETAEREPGMLAFPGAVGVTAGRVPPQDGALAGNLTCPARRW